MSKQRLRTCSANNMSLQTHFSSRQSNAPALVTTLTMAKDTHEKAKTYAPTIKVTLTEGNWPHLKRCKINKVNLK